MDKQNKIKIIQYVPPLWNGLTNIFCFNISHIPNPVNSHIYIHTRIICGTIKKEILLYGCVLVQMSFRMCMYFFCRAKFAKYRFCVMFPIHRSERELYWFPGNQTVLFGVHVAASNIVSGILNCLYTHFTTDKIFTTSSLYSGFFPLFPLL